MGITDTCAVMCHFNDLLLNAGFPDFTKVSELENMFYMSDNGNAHLGNVFLTVRLAPLNHLQLKDSNRLSDNRCLEI